MMTYPEWFLANLVRVFPIKPKDKVPACKSWDDYVAKPAVARTWVNYGVVLGFKDGLPGGGLAVADTDSPEAEAWARRNLPSTPFMVQTGKGVHRYYRIAQSAPKYMHRDGHTIEFRNERQYVVGPGSIHATGKRYTAAPWHRDFDELPIFPVDTFLWDDRTGNTAVGVPAATRGFIPPMRVAAGERHDYMYRILRSFQSRGVPDAACIDICVVMNRQICAPPLDEREVRKYLGRVCRVPDRAQWQRRTPASGWDVFLSLIDHDSDPDENGHMQMVVPREVAIFAARAVDPTFDADADWSAP